MGRYGATTFQGNGLEQMKSEISHALECIAYQLENPPIPSLKQRVIDLVAIELNRNIDFSGAILTELQRRVGQDSFFNWCGEPGRTEAEVLEVLRRHLNPPAP